MYQEYACAEVVETAMRLAGGQQHVNEVIGVVHVGDCLVQSVHDQQGVILERTARPEVGLVHRPELLEHSHDVLARLKHPITRMLYSDSTSIRRAFDDCFSKVIKVTVT